MSVSPKGFNATMELQAEVIQTKKIEALSGKKELISYPVPDLGFEIKHLCTVGLTLKYQIGYSTKLYGKEKFSFGATSSLPDDAVISIDFKDHDRSFHKGLEGAVLHPLFDVKSMTSSVKFAVYTQADISFGIDLEKIAKADVELNLRIPQLSNTINAGYSKHFPRPVLKSELITNLSVLIDKGGFCSHEDGAIETGAKMTTALSIELWFEVFLGKAKKEGEEEKKKENWYSNRLFNFVKTLDEQCKALDIESLLESPEEMAASSLLPLSAVPSLGY